MYDLIIRNGYMIDGTGNMPYSADIGIKDGKIAAIGTIPEEGADEIDADGLCVTPGFIDSHSHSDNAIFVHSHQKEKVLQGITTSIAGNCGSSPAPLAIDDPGENSIGSYGKAKDLLATFGSFLDTAKDVPLGANLCLLVGHKSLRLAVIGHENRPATKDELQKMCALLEEGMQKGAFGLSFGLIYAPSCFADTEELVELAKICAKYGGVISAHMRNEEDFVEEAVAEMIEVAKKSGARTVISHHKAMRKPNWGKVRNTLAMIDKANGEGADIYCDVYPYIASCTTLSSRIVRKEHYDGGPKVLAERLRDATLRKELKQWNKERYENDLSWIMLPEVEGHPEYNGKTIPEIAEISNRDPFDTAMDLVADSENNVQGCFFTMCEEDLEQVLSYPRAMICTDAGVLATGGLLHPRTTGTFPRVLGRYIREKKLVPLTEMIRRMTYVPAQVYHLPQKGEIAVGKDADICIFNSETIIDTADFTDYGAPNEGLHYVIVNGKIAMTGGLQTSEMAGRVILKN